MVEYRAKPLDRVFFALADPTRRAVLVRLADGELTVTAIAAPFGISLAAVSKHIRVLEEAGLVKRTRAGREHRLQFVPQPLRAAVEWANRFERLWSDQLQSIKEIAERKVQEKKRQSST
jgi:DNA-binding transcriptional ArsR family regulator